MRADDEPRIANQQADIAILIAIAAAVALLHLFTNSRYGFHRDELQFLSDVRHLDWGFVAYPAPAPNTIIVLGLSAKDANALFTGCRLAGHDGNSEGVRNEGSVDHPDIFVCGPLRKPWPEFWKENLWFG